ncbi:MAG: hypothetical protein Q8O43_04420 [Dehalococcoidia bacterium]|nr:hypothetical protein [Dehalococcoidia bacterium]
MGKKTLEVEISDNLHERLYRIVPDPAFLFRNTKETAYRAIERAVELAVTQFLDNLEKRAKASSGNSASQ